MNQTEFVEAAYEPIILEKNILNSTFLETTILWFSQVSKPPVSIVAGMHYTNEPFTTTCFKTFLENFHWIAIALIGRSDKHTIHSSNLDQLPFPLSSALYGKNVGCEGARN